MADFLFSFVGRQNRLAYLVQLLVSAAAMAAVLAVSAAMGDWAFKGIVLGVLIAAAICVYVSAVTNRLQDLGASPLVGLLVYFALPIAIVLVMSSVVGEGYFEAIGAGINALVTGQPAEPMPENQVAWRTSGLAAAIFLFGQLRLLLKRGDRGANSYGEAPTGWIGHTRPEGA